MEPVITKEGYKILQNPDVSRNLLGAYYETIGFRVVEATGKGETEHPNKSDYNNEQMSETVPKR